MLLRKWQRQRRTPELLLDRRYSGLRLLAEQVQQFHKRAQSEFSAAHALQLRGQRPSGRDRGVQRQRVKPALQVVRVKFVAAIRWRTEQHLPE
jgi:hypothetical protein